MNMQNKKKIADYFIIMFYYISVYQRITPPTPQSVINFRKDILFESNNHQNRQSQIQGTQQNHIYSR